MVNSTNVLLVKHFTVNAQKVLITPIFGYKNFYSQNVFVRIQSL